MALVVSIAEFGNQAVLPPRPSPNVQTSVSPQHSGLLPQNLHSVFSYVIFVF
jgi:hypothetical protein